MKNSGAWFPEKLSTYKTGNLLEFINTKNLGFTSNI